MGRGTSMDGIWINGPRTLSNFSFFFIIIKGYKFVE